MVCAVSLAATAQPSVAEPAESSVTPVALLEAEFIAHDVTADVPEERLQLLGWLDAALMEAMADQPGIMLIDRQSIDRLIAERARDPLQQRADPRQPVLASTVLVCPTILAAKDSDKATVHVTAVFAERGDLLAEFSVLIDTSPQTRAALANAKLPVPDFWKRARLRLNHRGNATALEVTPIVLDSPSQRLRWLADDLTDRLAATTPAGVVHLEPRGLLHTKEERLLSVAGLTQPGAEQRARVIPSEILSKVVDGVMIRRRVV